MNILRNSPAERLAALRSFMIAEMLDGIVVPRGDAHLGEYVPASAERLAWLSGFTGSAGLAVVLATRAAVFTDGRYTLQVERETDAALWERRHLVDQPPRAWIGENTQAGARIGYDPRLTSAEMLTRLSVDGRVLVALDANPIDALWADRPPAPASPLRIQPLSLAGVSSGEKRADLARLLREAGEDAVVLTDPASVAWLFNVRADDLEFTPVPLAFAIVRGEAAMLFLDPMRVDDAARAWLGNVELRAPDELDAALAELAGARVRVDPAGTAVWFEHRLLAAGAIVAAGTDPCAMPKARKSAAEQAGARAAHQRDGVAVCRFLHWLDGARGQSEMSVAARLLAFRREVPGFRGESFPAIVGAGAHGAVIHYRATPATDAPVERDQVVLIDSGGQFDDGTTDVTRTVWTGSGPAPEPVRTRTTAVLRGHIAIADLIFPDGVAGTHLDALARVALWRLGLDYDHGTGHGVGSALSVHEGPAGLSRAARPVALAEGMILSDEPGFYQAGEYGIRLENLLLVRHADLAANKPFLRFETLTLAPFDRRLLNRSMMTAAEIAWLDAYHARVVTEIGPALDDDARAWLETACAPL